MIEMSGKIQEWYNINRSDGRIWENWAAHASTEIIGMWRKVQVSHAVEKTLASAHESSTGQTVDESDMTIIGWSDVQ